MMRLIFHTGPRAGNEVNTSAQLIRLGRDPANNDVVVDDPQVSGRHCILTRSPRGTYVLEDLGSSNGTFVAEAVDALPKTPIEVGVKREVGPDDRIYVGSWTRLVIRKAAPGEVT